MRKIVSMLILLLAIAGTSYAQDDGWQSGSDGIEYNCDVVGFVLDVFDSNDQDAVTVILILDFIRSGDNEFDLKEFLGIRTAELLLDDAEITFDTLFVNALDACDAESETDDRSVDSDSDTFNVVVNGNVNVRSCPGTDCEVVGQASNDSVLTVISEQDDWYEFEFEGETAYIASWLTERGPDVFIEDLTETYRDERTGCAIVADASRGDMEMQFVIFGDDRNDIFIDLYRPNDDNALDVEAQLDKTFSDTGEPYIQQYYHWGLYWSTGVYEIEINYDGETSRIAWDVSDQFDYNLFVTCD